MNRVLRNTVFLSLQLLSTPPGDAGTEARTVNTKAAVVSDAPLELSFNLFE